MSPVRPDRLLRMLLGWTVVTMIFTWLPLIRGLMDGPSYAWGTSFWGYRVGGTGIGGDYWVLVSQAVLGLSVLALGWRGAQAPFHAMLLLWHGVLGSSAVYSALTRPEQYRFRGDTMGIDISVAWVAPLLFGGFFLLALWWVVRDYRRGTSRATPAWTRANSVWLALLGSMLPLQYVLLHFGEPHGLTDKIGVVITVTQCLLLGRIFRPGRVGHAGGFLTNAGMQAT